MQLPTNHNEAKALARRARILAHHIYNLMERIDQDDPRLARMQRRFWRCCGVADEADRRAVVTDPARFA